MAADGQGMSPDSVLRAGMRREFRGARGGEEVPGGEGVRDAQEVQAVQGEGEIEEKSGGRRRDKAEGFAAALGQRQAVQADAASHPTPSTETTLGG